MSEHESKSEVAHIMRQITLEYEAAQHGLTGVAYGTAQHAFISAKLESKVKMQEMTILWFKEAISLLESL